MPSNYEHRALALMALAMGAMGSQARAEDTSGHSGQGDTRQTTATMPRPNILWLTFEDCSAYEFGCYGNSAVHTPVIDSLAHAGVMFTNAWATAPQSSPARSSLITGCYATTYAMDFHPYAYETPSDILFPQLLRDAGYYCTNNDKTHYNTTTDNKSCWDECSKQASYNSESRAEGQPFFAVFNSVTSHMGRVRTFHMDGRRDYAAEGLDTGAFVLPAHLPDLPEMRSDYAAHLEGIQDIDTWLGWFLDDLKAHGLDQSTIVFFFSDHGGCLPRGKGLPFESGLRVPLIVYVPEAYRALCRSEMGTTDDQMVNFVDLGPTVLSLAGIEPPKHMQGRAIMGEYAAQGDKQMDFGFDANQLHHFMPMRVARTQKYKFFRTYIPYRQFALRNYYQWGMPANKAWDSLVLSGADIDPIYKEPFLRHPAEMIFDLEADPFETKDLSSDPSVRKELKRFRHAMHRQIRSTVDLGFFLPTSRERGCLYDEVRSGKYPLEEIWDLSERAGLGRVKDLKRFERGLGSACDEVRFWSVVGIATLATQGSISTCPEGIEPLMYDLNPYVAAEACLAVAYLGDSRGAIHILANEGGEQYRKVYFSALECIALDVAMSGNVTLREAFNAELPTLREVAEMFPRVQNEDPGFMARGILVDLGEMSVEDMHGRYGEPAVKGLSIDPYEEGLKLNHGRRRIAPKPTAD